MFAPPLNIRVYDDRVIAKPLIGTRSLPLEAFISWEAVRPNISEDAPKIVQEIPGAKSIKEDDKGEKPEAPAQMLVETDNTLFLTKHEQEMEDIKNKLSGDMTNRTLPEVQESFLAGAERKHFLFSK